MENNNKNNNKTPSVNPLNEVSTSKGEVLIENLDFYYTTEGYKCFTEHYHLKRGYCCQSGCKHCPYGFNKKKNL